MKRLLRGIIDFGKMSDEARVANFHRLELSPVQWTQPADERIYRFTKDFFEAELDLPSAKVLADYFTRAEDYEAIERLKDIKEAPSFDGSDYSFVLKELVEEQARLRLCKLLDDAKSAAGKGLMVEGAYGKKRKLQGVEDAIRYLEDEDLWSLLEDRKRPIQVHDMEMETHESKRDYLKAKNNPSTAWGVLSGLEPLDTACHGLKRGEMWIHAGHTGEMKSTIALTVAYNAKTRYRRHVVYVSLESHIKKFRRDLHVLHSSHRKWAKPLDNRRVRDGQLTDDEEALYFEVLEDFRENPKYTRFSTITVGQEGLTPRKLRTELDRLHREFEVGLVIVDHAELMKPPRRDHNHGVEINAIYHELRKISLTFDGGAGLPMLVLHQTNRQGKDRAAKEDGRYTSSSALSWANEAERSASMVTWSYRDEALITANKVRLGCLKNRDNPRFDPFEANFDPLSKRISFPSEEIRKMAEEMAGEAMDELELV